MTPEELESLAAIHADFHARRATPARPPRGTPEPPPPPPPRKTLEAELAEIAEDRARSMAELERSIAAADERERARQDEDRARRATDAAHSLLRDLEREGREKAEAAARHEAGMQPVRDLARFLADRIEHGHLSRVIAAIGRVNPERLADEMREIWRIENDDVRHRRRTPTKVSALAARQAELDEGVL